MKLTPDGAKKEKESGRAEDICVEFELLARLRHPNIVAAYALLTNESHMAMVMEIAENNLECCIYGVPCEIPCRNKWVWLFHACDGLNFVHSKQILHLDVKPDNLLLFGHPEVSECKLKVRLGLMPGHIICVIFFAVFHFPFRVCLWLALILLVFCQE